VPSVFLNTSIELPTVKELTMTRSLLERTLLWFLLLAAALLTAVAGAADKQAGQLQARHKAGQTLLTYVEVDPPVTEDSIPAQELRNLRRTLDKDRKLRYRV